MRYWVSVLVLVGACEASPGVEAPALETANLDAADSDASPADGNRQTASAFCKLVYEANRAELSASCSVAEKKRPAYAEHLALVSAPTSACVEMITPGLAAGRLTLDQQRSNLCAKHLASMGWQRALWDRSLAVHPPCTDLARGHQKAGQACRLSLECEGPLWCAGADFSKDGTCRGVVKNAPCDAPAAWLFDEERAVCGPDHHCSYGPFQPAYVRGLAVRREPTSIGGSMELEPHRPLFRDTGHLPKEDAARVFESKREQFQDCMEAARRAGVETDGTVDFTLQVERGGNAELIELTVAPEGTPPYAKVSTLRNCLGQQLDGVRFSAPGGRVRLRHRMRFTTLSDAAGARPVSSSEQTPVTPASLTPPTGPRTCAPDLETGASCRASQECRLGLVCRNFTCRPRGALAADCHGDLECQPGLHCEPQPYLETQKNRSGLCAKTELVGGCPSAR